MKKYYLVLAVGVFCLSACQKDEIAEESAELEVVTEEYFRAQIDGIPIEAKGPDNIAGTAYPSDHSGIINFDFHATIPDEAKGKDFYQEFSFKVCFYDGPGTYYTGTDKTVSWAVYWSGDYLWENGQSYGNKPGKVIVTKASEKFVEGTFDFWAYNWNMNTNVHVVGEFGLKLESPDNY